MPSSSSPFFSSSTLGKKKGRLSEKKPKSSQKLYRERFPRRPYLVAGLGADRHGAARDAGDRDGRAAGARERGGAEGGGGGESHIGFERSSFSSRAREEGVRE